MTEFANTEDALAAQSLALKEACRMLSGSWDCPWAHYGEGFPIACVKDRPADGPGSCMMTNEDIADCWRIHLMRRANVGAACDEALRINAEREAGDHGDNRV